MAGEGVEALFYLKDSHCQLVLTDYQMPAINGFQLGQKVKSLFPGTRVVIMTGLSPAEMAGMMSDHIIDAWLFKPFRIQELERTLARIRLPGRPAIYPNRPDDL
jgi:two-component system response regulator YesN